MGEKSPVKYHLLSSFLLFTYLVIGRSIKSQIKGTNSLFLLLHVFMSISIFWAQPRMQFQPRSYLLVSYNFHYFIIKGNFQPQLLLLCVFEPQKLL